MRALTRLACLLCFALMTVSTNAQILAFNNTNPDPDCGFYSFAPDSLIATQDYVMDSTLVTGDTCFLVSMNYVGGLVDSAGPLTVEFLTESGDVVSAWTFNLGAGIFNYNLTFDSVPIPFRGAVRVSAQNGNGEWFLNVPQSQIGNQDTLSSPRVNGKAVVYALGLMCAGDPLPCPQYVNLNFIPIPTGNYFAKLDLVTNGTIFSSGIVEMHAGNKVILGTHFEVQSGGFLEVLMDGCTE